jgi:hypothetical protein
LGDKCWWLRHPLAVTNKAEESLFPTLNGDRVSCKTAFHAGPKEKEEPSEPIYDCADDLRRFLASVTESRMTITLSRRRAFLQIHASAYLHPHT